MEKINSRLPGDIRNFRCRACEEWISCEEKVQLAKRYIYQLDLAEKPDVFTRRYTYQFSAEIGFRCDEKGSTIVDWHV